MLMMRKSWFLMETVNTLVSTLVTKPMLVTPSWTFSTGSKFLSYVLHLHYNYLWKIQPGIILKVMPKFLEFVSNLFVLIAFWQWSFVFRKDLFDNITKPFQNVSWKEVKICVVNVENLAWYQIILIFVETNSSWFLNIFQTALVLFSAELSQTSFKFLSKGKAEQGYI